MMEPRRALAHLSGPGMVGCSALSRSDYPIPHKHNARRPHHIPKMSFKVQNWAAVLSGWRVGFRHGRLLHMTTPPNPYRSFRYPAEVIQHAVWLYHCLSLSQRDVELILAARGTVVRYETIPEWGLRFGRLFANALKRRRPRPGDKWFLDEVFVRIQGKLRYLWRAVDQDGHVLDILVQSQHSARAAVRFFRQPLKGLQYVPRVIVTDKLRS